MQTEMLAAGESRNWRQRWSPWTASLIIHVIGLATLLSIRASVDPPLAFRQKQFVTPLVYLPPARPAPARVQATRIPLIAPPPARPHMLIVKQMPQMPKVNREQPQRPKITAPEPVAPAAAAAALPVARLNVPDLPSRPSPPPAPVKTGVFGNAGEAPNGRAPAPRLEVQTGGFSGVSADRSQAASGKAVRTGGFGDATTSGGVAASGNAVHTGGFGDATASGTGLRSGNGKSALVADAGFGNAADRSAPQHRAEAAPAETPVEVLWKPKPIYTSEARAKKLEGNVTLEVIFRATGDIRVVRVVSGLGCGLDESARAAAEQIRFRPGKKDGVPVDRTALVLITFELS